jgi:hypothetical protein
VKGGNGKPFPLLLMLGNDIIDLKEAGKITVRHVKKIFSSLEEKVHAIENYWKILAIKEAAFKCLQQMFDIESYIPKTFEVSNDFRYVIWNDMKLSVIKLEETNDIIHAVVSAKPDSKFYYGICENVKHKDSLINEYFKVTGFKSNSIIKELNPNSPNGFKPPYMDEHPGVPISFSHDGRFAAWCFQIF